MLMCDHLTLYSDHPALKKLGGSYVLPHTYMRFRVSFPDHYSASCFGWSEDETRNETTEAQLATTQMPVDVHGHVHVYEHTVLSLPAGTGWGDPGDCTH